MSMIVSIGKVEWNEYPLEKKELFLSRLHSSNVSFKDAIIKTLEVSYEQEKQGNVIDLDATFRKAYEEDE